MRGRLTISIWLMVLICSSWPVELLARESSEIKWEDVKIENDGETTQEYWLESNRHAYMDLYYSIDGGDTLHKRSGRLVPFLRRDFPFDGRVIIAVRLAPGQVLRGKLRRETQYYVGAMPIDRPISIELREKRERELWQFRTFTLIAIGIISFLLIYNTILFIATRFSRYRFYLPGVVTMVLVPAREGGILSSMFGTWENYPICEDFLGTLIMFGTVLTAPMFIRDVLDVPHRYPKLERYYRYYPLLAVAGLVLTFFSFRAGYEMVKWGLPLLLIGIIWILIINARRGYRYGIFILCGIGIFVLLTIVYWAGVSGFVYLHEDVLTLLLSLGTILLDLFMTFVLAAMVWDLRRENALQQQRIIGNLRQEQQTERKITLAVAEAREEVRRGFARLLEKDLLSQLETIREEATKIGNYDDPQQEGLVHLYDELLHLTQESIEKTRDIAHELMPEDLGGTDGLFGAIEEYLAHLPAHGMEVDYEYAGTPGLPLPVRALSYRVIRDLMAPILKQGTAALVQLRLMHENSLLHISLVDDGEAPSEAQQLDRAEKIEAIRLNLALFKGKFTETKNAGSGSEIKIEIPTT